MSFLRESAFGTWRSLRRLFLGRREERLFAFAVASTFALGICTLTSAFSVVNSVLLRPLPVREQEDIVVIAATDRAQSSSHLPLSNAAMWQMGAGRSAVAATAIPMMDGATPPRPISDGDRVISIAITASPGSLFDVLGVRPFRGRLLSSGDDHSGDAVIVLSYSAWQKYFGGRPDILNRPLRISGTTYRVVGIAPPEFDFPARTDAWVSAAQLERLFGMADMASMPDEGYWDIVMRLKPGVKLEQARAEALSIVKHNTSPALGAIDSRAVRVRKYADVVVGDQRLALYILSAAAALVFTIALANVAGLVVTRSLHRIPETAIRAALGGSWFRIGLSLAAEHALLGVLGGAAGILLSAVLLRITTLVVPTSLNFARFDTLALGLPGFLFGLLSTSVAILFCAVVPAIKMTGKEMRLSIGASHRSIGGSHDTTRIRQTLVTFEVAIAVMVVVCSGVLLRTLANLHRVELGFDPAHVLYVLVQELEVPQGATEETEGPRHRFLMSSLVEQLPSYPGITGAAITGMVPFEALSAAGGFEMTYESETSSGFAMVASQSPTISSATNHGGPIATMDVVSPTFFSVLGAHVIRGRNFTSADVKGAPRVVLINEKLARDSWPNQDPIGKQIRFVNTTTGERSMPRTVVGIVSDVRYQSLTSIRPFIYQSSAQSEPGAVIAIRTSGSPLEHVATVRRVLHSLDPGYAVGQTYSGRDLLDAAISRPRLTAIALVSLATAAVLLAAIGLFSVLSFNVEQRVREIGLRIALGATRNSIGRLIIRQAVVLVTIGIAIGVLLALAGTRVLRSQLFQVATTDPLTIAATTLLVLFVAAGAASLPILRAIRVTPLVALREG